MTALEKVLAPLDARDKKIAIRYFLWLLGGERISSLAPRYSHMTQQTASALPTAATRAAAKELYRIASTGKP